MRTLSQASLKALRTWPALPSLLFAALLLGVQQGWLSSLDSGLLAWFHLIRNPFLDALALDLTRSASWPFMSLLVLAILVWAWLSGRDARSFLTAVAGTEALNLLTKWLVARPRPDLFPRLVHESDFGFPSGHTMASLALVLALAHLAQDRPRMRRWILVLGLPWALLVGISRLYLQVHYPTDVLGGWLLTLAWLGALNLYWCQRHAPSRSGG